MAQGTLTWTFQYDTAANRTRLTHPNGTSTDYAYLNNHWLQSITDKGPGGATFQTTSYGYDQNGNRISQADPSGTTTFAYDALNRLTQAAYPAGYGTWAWTYDPIGNRTQQTGPGGTTTYVYDATNRLLQATAGTTTTYSYDDNGNLTALSTGQTFAWDVFNRLTQATGPGGTVTHTFNGDGLKVRRVGPDGTIHYFYDGIKPIYETDGAGQFLFQYDRDIFGNLLARLSATQTRRYYHYDGLGSVTAMTTPTGEAAFALLYDAWGNLRASTGTPNTRYRFTGAELDPVTGLYHMGARFYDSTLGRWLSEDPVQDKPFEPFSLNFYAYVEGNPGVLIDADGRSAVMPRSGYSDLILIGAAIVTTVASALLANTPLTRATIALFRSSDGAAAKIRELERRMRNADAALHVKSKDMTDVLYRARAGDPRALNDLKNIKDRVAGLLREIRKEKANPLTEEQKRALEALEDIVRQLQNEIDSVLNSAGESP